jgi:putative copper export protein
VTTSNGELLRLTLHVIAASVWVGGQLALAALVPSLRRVSAQAPAVAARAFARIAWPAFAVLLATGAWNAWAVRDQMHGSYAVVFTSKLLVVSLSGLTAWLHARATTTAARASFGAATAGFALLALLLGVQLTL